MRKGEKKGEEERKPFFFYLDISYVTFQDTEVCTKSERKKQQLMFQITIVVYSVFKLIGCSSPTEIQVQTQKPEKGE